LNLAQKRSRFTGSRFWLRVPAREREKV